MSSAKQDANSVSASNTTANEPIKLKSNYQLVKEGGWTGRPNFQYSHGLKMDPDGIEEGNAILEEFRKYDYALQSGMNDKGDEASKDNGWEKYAEKYEQAKKTK